MKKLLNLVILVGFSTFLGCAAIKEAVSDGQACYKDPVCFADAVSKANEAKTKITQVAGVASPIPWVPVAAGATGGVLVFLFSLVKGGKKKREDEVK